MIFYRTGFVLASLAMVSLLSLSGCASQYRPVKGPRVSIVQDDSGKIAYVRDGFLYWDFMGSGLIDAVSPDPEALEYAESAQTTKIAGTVAGVIGLGLFMVPFLNPDIFIDDLFDSDDNTGLFFLIAGDVLLLIGGLLVLKSQADSFDAINMYNDTLEYRYAPVPAPAKVENTPVRVRTVEEDGVEETMPLEEPAPADEMPIEEAPADEAPAEEAPAEEAPAEEVPVTPTPQSAPE